MKSCLLDAVFYFWICQEKFLCKTQHHGCFSLPGFSFLTCPHWITAMRLLYQNLHWSHYEWTLKKSCPMLLASHTFIEVLYKVLKFIFLTLLLLSYAILKLILVRNTMSKVYVFFPGEKRVRLVFLNFSAHPEYCPVYLSASYCWDRS